ncbi:hypothetical protein AVW11_18055 [Streptomyces amritsarensis]|uniref:Uncharacterized protein n=1 Tax=Streptomyces amritsarensis TaxID=681158 RepID=A0ABX3G3A9_9ACTN|nr:hypothetical protein AVW11_18055 [Streptomyces amritsarensis]
MPLRLRQHDLLRADHGRLGARGRPLLSLLFLGPQQSVQVQPHRVHRAVVVHPPARPLGGGRGFVEDAGNNLGRGDVLDVDKLYGAGFMGSQD